MTSWRGWVATQPSRLTWDEWRQYQQRRASGAMPELASGEDHPAEPAMPELRIAALEELCSLLTVENAGLKTALDHWQRQPVAIGG